MSTIKFLKGYVDREQCCDDKPHDWDIKEDHEMDLIVFCRRCKFWCSK